MAHTTSSKKRKKIPSKKTNISSLLFVLGLVFVLPGLLILSLTFFPVVKEEVKYSLESKIDNKAKTIIPVDREFGIVIPKILANARVIPNIDPYDSKVYQQALTRGVAHALGSAFPGRAGNTFIFAHSSADWYTANRFNSVFYLLTKLENGDEIELYYQNKKYIYKVFDKKYVDPDEVSYLKNNIGNSSYLTLMTCWPPGTTFKRLIIQAKISTLDK